VNLLEIRTQFAKLSGRYDLVDGSFADNGADYYIKAGIKFLDRRVGFDKDIVKEITAVSIGDYSLDVDNQRSIKEVWFVTSSGSKLLTYLTPIAMRELFSDSSFADVDNATTTYWTMALDTDQLGSVGIVTMPPTDIDGDLEVWFKRSTPWPSAEDAENFWMTNFEDVCVNAALYKLEVSYRNTAGARDWLASMELDLLGIEKDTVD